MYAQILQGLHCRADTSDGRQANVFDKHVLGCSRTTLHAVQHNHICAGFDRERGVKIGACTTDFQIDRYFPAGDFPQFENFNFKIVRAGPIGMTTGGPLIDTLGQVAHFCHPVTDFLA